MTIDFNKTYSKEIEIERMFVDMKVLLTLPTLDNKLSRKSDYSPCNYNLAPSKYNYDTVSFGSINKKQLGSVFDFAYVKLNKIDLNEFERLFEKIS